MDNVLKKISTDNTDRVYLDIASATPMDKEVLLAMSPYFVDFYGNPNSIHEEGRTARSAIDSARTQVARCLQVRDELVTFTSGGTESNNLAIIGYINSLYRTGLAYKEMHIITSSIEHPSILKTLEELGHWGVRVDFVTLNEFGMIEVEDLYNKLRPETVLVTVAHINSEIGVIQDTLKISKKISLYARNNNQKRRALLHVDAAQSPLWKSVHMSKLGADLLSLDASKFYGPKGIGVLVANQKQPIEHGVMFGGSQEHNLRPGTESVPLIVGFAKALLFAQDKYLERSTYVSKLRDFLINNLLQINGVIVNGPLGDMRVANNVNISIPGLDTEFASIVLDKAGFSVGTKSACSTVSSDTSNVVLGISGDTGRAMSTLRFTLHERVSKDQLGRLLNVLSDHVQKMKGFSSL